MSNKQQFSRESKSQFNKPISFLTYKLNWIFCRLQGEGSWTYISTGEDSDYVNEKSTPEYVNQNAAPEYVNQIPTPEYVNAWVDCS